MLAFAFFNPSVINLLIDKKKYTTLFLDKDSDEAEISDFLHKKTPKAKVLILEGIENRKRIKNLTNVRLVVFDTPNNIEAAKIAENLRVIPVDYLIDAGVPVVRNIAIEQLNDLIITDSEYSE